MENMSDEERKGRHMDPENVKELLSVVSTEIPTMIKSIGSPKICFIGVVVS
jgi:hypothetical protein